MSDLYVDPAGSYAIQSSDRLVEAWAVEPIRFEGKDRPEWQNGEDGFVARLHRGLRSMQPRDDDVLACAFTDPERENPADVENRLFTNVKEPPWPRAQASRQPNAFATLPRDIRFERRFVQAQPPAGMSGGATVVGYRYALEPAASQWSGWQVVGDPLARWDLIEVTGMSDQAAWPTLLAMRRQAAGVRVRHEGPPLAADFAVRLSLHACRNVQAVTVMESLVDGVVASFQRERELARAQRVACCLQRRNRKLAAIPVDELVAAQVAAPAVLAGSPWAMSPAGTWCQMSPADRWVVAGALSVTRTPGATAHRLSGELVRVVPVAG